MPSFLYAPDSTRLRIAYALAFLPIPNVNRAGVVLTFSALPVYMKVLEPEGSVRKPRTAWWRAATTEMLFTVREAVYFSRENWDSWSVARSGENSAAETEVRRIRDEGGGGRNVQSVTWGQAS